MDLEQLARIALREACEAHIPRPKAEGEPTKRSLSSAAVIGFVGDDVTGTIGVATSDQGLERVAEQFGVTGDDQSLATDALGELANFMSGHLKRACLVHGIQIEVAPPQLVRGIAMEFRSMRPEGLLVEEVSGDDDRVVGWIDLESCAHVEVSASGLSEGELPAAPGESFLF